MKNYYTLIAIEKGLIQRGEIESYSILFGDYDKAVVEEEKSDNQYYGMEYKAYKIIKTSDKQKDIETKLKELNSQLKGYK
jgi:hypothetical protein